MTDIIRMFRDRFPQTTHVHIIDDDRISVYTELTMDQARHMALAIPCEREIKCDDCGKVFRVFRPKARLTRCAACRAERRRMKRLEYPSIRKINHAS